MPTVEERLVILERQIKTALATTSALQGQPADATLSIPHNDSFPFEDNVDATHAANLRYIISKNVTRVVSARLSIFMAPYRTYNTLSVSATGTESAGHSHGHSHTWAVQDGTGIPTANMVFGNSPIAVKNIGGTTGNVPTTTDSTGESATHTHNVSATGVLGVTEGATAAGVTISFDGVDQTAALGGPFNADVIELDVRRFLITTIGVYHTIALQPTGNGRIEAHLRLGYYASAGSVF